MLDETNNKEFLKALKRIVSLSKKINDLEAEKKHLEELAYTDKLTGLKNRTYYEEWLEKNNNMSIYPIAVISADCNGLKAINDTYGHSIGDEYIKASADVLRELLPEKAVIARVGGDEFTAIIPNTSIEEMTNIVSFLRFESKHRQIKTGERVSISFGSAYSESHIANISELFNIADEDMYAEKRENKRLMMRVH